MRVRSLSHSSPRSFPRGSALLPAAAFALLSLVAPTAFAEEAAEVPPHTRWDYALAQEALPEGMKLLPEDDAGCAESRAALTAAVKAAAQAGSISADDVGVTLKSVSAEAGVATVALVDLPEGGDAASKSLADAATAKGYAHRTFGSPLRVVVVAGPEALGKDLLRVQTRWAAHLLGVKARSAIESRNGAGAARLATALVAIEPKSTPGNWILGVKAAEEQDFVEAAKRWRAAIAKDAFEPFTGADRAALAGDLAGVILNADPGPSKEARELLQDAVAHASEASRGQRIGFRYNLACAHGRLKEIDEAFTHLEGALKEDASDPIQGISHWRKDPDLAPLHDDPRWKALLEKYPEGVDPSK